MKFQFVLDSDETEVTNFDVAKAVIDLCHKRAFLKPGAFRLDPVTISKLILVQEESENAE